MRLKTFTAPTMAQAMADIRAALGDDAVIVGVDEEAGGIRVTAAVDAEAVVPAPAFPIDPVDAVFRVLRHHAVPAAAAEPLLDQAGSRATADPTGTLAAALDATSRFEPVGNAPGARVLMLVGPPGGGKTQTAAKLAARSLLAGRRVALLSTDTARMGGVSQLAAFAKALRLDLVAADTPKALADAVRAAVRTAADVIIEGAGRNHLDRPEMETVATLADAAEAEPLLVLPAGLDVQESAEIATAFAGVGVRRLIATRLDLARRYGGCVAAAYEADLAFCEFSATPRVKDGLMPAGAAAFAGLLIAAVPDLAPRFQTEAAE